MKRVEKNTQNKNEHKWPQNLVQNGTWKEGMWFFCLFHTFVFFRFPCIMNRIWVNIILFHLYMYYGTNSMLACRYTTLRWQNRTAIDVIDRDENHIQWHWCEFNGMLPCVCDAGMLINEKIAEINFAKR